MSEVLIYSADNCSYCVKAKQLLDEKKVTYKELRVDEDAGLRLEMVEKTGRRSVPQIFINGQHIGGCDDLYALDRQGALDNLLSK